MGQQIRRRVFLAATGAAGLAGCTTFGGDDSQDTTEDDPTDAETADDEDSGDIDDAQPSEPSFEIIETSVGRRELFEDETVDIEILVANEGDDEGEFEVTVTFGGQSLHTETVPLEAGEERTLQLTTELPLLGIRPLAINQTHIETVLVKPRTLETERDVCAHYYPWYGAPAHDYQDGEWSLESPSRPVLGNYNSTDEEVIEQHFDWCHEAGVSWLNVAWWGEGSHEDNRFKNDLLEHPRAHEFDWSVLYETEGQFHRGEIDMGEKSNREQLRQDLVYLSETYFNRDMYKTLDDRPVLYLYVAHSFRGPVAEAFSDALEPIDEEPYLVAHIPEGSTVDSFPIMDIADAVTTYNPYAPDEAIESIYLDRLSEVYRSWYLAGQHTGIDVIPTALPGYDDTEIIHDPRDNPPLAPSPEQYEQAAEITCSFADGPVFVTSFNEWYEDTQIEPSEEYGTAYLDITADILATETCEPPEIDGTAIELQFETTVDEAERNSDIDHGRMLSMRVEGLTAEDTSGNTVLDVDVGADESDLDVLLGSYNTESHEEATWRWFGGDGTTLLSVPEIPEEGTVELFGEGVAEMDVTVAIDGEERGTGSVGTSFGPHRIHYG